MSDMELSSSEERFLHWVVRSGRDGNYTGVICKWLMLIMIPLLVVGYTWQGIEYYRQYDALARQSGSYRIVERAEQENRGLTRDEWKIVQAAQHMADKFLFAFYFAILFGLYMLIRRYHVITWKLAAHSCNFTQ